MYDQFDLYDSDFIHVTFKNKLKKKIDKNE